ncbi:hypothetical protein [Streptomyces sp. 020-2-3H-GM]|uniref:hypothetical protein n=1 Tax=Streptomyces sp. 020-2-3H-GM TaxID=2789258 RepID=UPI00398005A6
MTDTSMTPDAALARLRQYGERTSTWSTATYNDGTEKALHQIAVSLAAEVDRLRGELSDATAEMAENARAMNALRRHRDTAENRVRELEALKPARFQDCQVCGAGYEYGKPCSACEFKKQLAAPKPARRDLRSGAAAARRMLRRPGACFTCGDVPDEWCPDCACCKAGCDGGRTNNPCTHPNAPWNTGATR